MVDTRCSRAVLLHLDAAALTEDQRLLLERSVGTSRAVYNWGLATINAWNGQRYAWLRERAHAFAGTDEEAEVLLGDADWKRNALRQAPEELRQCPNRTSLSRRFTELSRDPESRFHWWHVENHGVSRFVVGAALSNLDAAIARYWDHRGAPIRLSRKPRKDCRPSGWPRFKKKHRSKDSFAIFNLSVTSRGDNPWKVIDKGHRIRIPNLGSLRVQENTRRLRRWIQRGAIPKSARFVRRGTGWTVSIILDVPTEAIPAPVATRRQRAAGTVGVDVGVHSLVALSTDELVAGHPSAAFNRRLRRLQQHAARQRGPRNVQGPSAGWVDTTRRIARLQHADTLRRRGRLHEVTKRIATEFETIGIEDLAVSGMTAAPRPKPDPARPGSFLPNGRRAKASLNRSIRRAGFGELRRQLQYKTSWYGARLIAVDRFAPTSKTCSDCGAVKATLRLSERVYRCEQCGLILDRDLNAARNIRSLAVHSPSTVDTADVKHCGTPTSSRPQPGRCVSARPAEGQASEASNGPPVPTP
ncbi:RNA-guided endonuclease TnpB family protein [Rhodococcus sp. Q]|uniref:RNA-guided endonuclease InsQ/TnpB family protein n=1 Tax=Rhodococcus sp. Q TaxID=2502252 RepID=UPI0010F8B3DE|nr:RNA-guided endonuclease TnpB family protein [Rhodococcus sp. Q]